VTDARPRTSAVSPPSVDWTRVRRVLLIRLRSIGDTVLMTPCLQALSDWRPAVQVSVVLEPLAAPVLKGHPLVDHLFVAGKSFASKSALIRRLRREKFDVAFNLHGGTTGMSIAAMCGAEHTFAYRGHRGSWLLTDRAPGPDVILERDRIHSVEQQLALLHWAGVPMPAKPQLALEIDSNAATSARERLVAAGVPGAQVISSQFAIVAPGATFESKRWSGSRFSSVIDHLSSRWRLESIIVGGPGQERLAREVADASSSNPRVLSGVSLAELKALIGSSGRIFIGNDSGPMHIAAALKCPVVAVFGSSNPDVWRPWTKSPYRVLGGEHGTADNETRSTIDRIAIDEVISAVDEVLESAATRTAS
jgi:lipopolysaccharide heptosyltransferase III